MTAIHSTLSTLQALEVSLATILGNKPTGSVMGLIDSLALPDGVYVEVLKVLAEGSNATDRESAKKVLWVMGSTV